MGQITAQPFGIQANLVHANQADGGEMILKTSQVTLGVWIQTVIQQSGDNLSLDVKGSRRNIHQTIQSAVKLFRSL